MTSNGDLITVEYAGEASRQVGSYPLHDVRAWWTVRDEGSDGRVKLAAGRELKRHITADHVEFVTMDADRYKWPSINAMVTFRVLTHDQFTARAELRSRVYTTCQGCGSGSPGHLLRMRADGSERALCYPCLRALPDGTQYATVAWIKADGKLQV